MNNMNSCGIVWMSAGNSYFEEHIIRNILESVKDKFDKTIVMAPDEPAEHTFKALGYEGNKMKKKARLNANLLQNRAKRMIEELSEKDQSKFKVIEWTDEIIPNNAYQNKLKEIVNLYQTNEDFRKDALETSKKVIENKINQSDKEINLEEASQEAVFYLLKELAFVLASPQICGTNKSTYVYHHEWPIFEKLISGNYDGIIREELKFLLLK